MQWTASMAAIAIIAISITACAPSRDDGWGDIAKGVGYVLRDKG